MYLSRLCRNLHIEKSYEDPGISQMAKLELALWVIKDSPGHQRQREGPLPTYYPRCGVARQPRPEDAIGRCIYLFIFFGFLRSGETTVPIRLDIRGAVTLDLP